MKRKGANKKVWTTLGIVLMIAMLFFGHLVNFLSDFQWFSEIGYSAVFIKQVFSRLYLGVPFFVVFFTFIYIYLRRIKRHYYLHMHVVADAKEEKSVNRVLMLLSIAIALLFSLILASNFWMEILQFIHSTSFDIREPIFGKDVAFYVFTLPLVHQVFSYMLVLMFFLLLATVAMYMTLAVIRPPADQEERSNVRRLRAGYISPETGRKIKNLAFGHIMVIAAVFFLVLGLRIYLLSFSLLYSPRGAAFGAGYTDIHVSLWVYRIQMAVCLLSALLSLLAIYRRKPKLAAVGPILLIAVYLLGMGAEIFVQGIIVSPNELEKERPYIEYGIEYTRKAYGLDTVEVTEFAAEDSLSYEQILENEETIQNISLNDYRPTKEAFNQLQGLRGYYNFHDVDIDRYMLDGKLTQVFLSVRELDKSRLDDNAKNWINEKLKYTHGYGLTMAPVNRVTAAGQPQMLIRNVPPVSDDPSLAITRPQIYFGEMTDDYVITNSKEKEFDYPAGESLETTNYEGSAGIRLSFPNRLLYALKEGNLKLLISGSITGESRILIHRNILRRARRIAPFLSYDEDPYAVLIDGKIFYIIDAFTTTSYYPYSEPMQEQEINYMRNSVKLIVDAYNGSIDYYISDPSDPIARTYQKIFPGLFRDIGEMPESFRAHLRYPQKYFDLQSAMYRQYHMTQPEMFYNREDQWEIAMQNYGGQHAPMESLYFTFKLPGEERAEFVLSIPYTPNKKQNMTAFLVGRNDGENYGRLRLYKFPKNRTVAGIEQVEAKISNDDMISKDLSLWDSRGSQVIRGNMLTIPINDSLLYIEPLYMRADSENAIPEVRRIIAYYNDEVVMEDSLDKALMQLFGGSPKDRKPFEGAGENSLQPGSSDEDLSLQEQVRRANELYEQAQEALRQGSLREYEERIHQLGDLLKNMEQDGL